MNQTESLPQGYPRKIRKKDPALIIWGVLIGIGVLDFAYSSLNSPSKEDIAAELENSFNARIEKIQNDYQAEIEAYKKTIEEVKGETEEISMDEFELYKLEMQLSERKEKLTKSFSVADSMLYYYEKFDEIQDQDIMNEIRSIDEKIIGYRKQRNEIERKKYSYKFVSETVGLQ